ncbi:MAG: hypothetical protein LCH84_10510 [Gemmatimonadetes bacterium]|nr:hypothetical protein [Gemmatimonadota bacterium]
MQLAPLRTASQPPASRPSAGDTARPLSRAQYGVAVAPDTVTVGDRFRFIVTVVVPEGSRIDWPRLTDSTADIAMHGAVRIVDGGTKLGSHTERAEYELSAWNVGPLPIGMPPVVVQAPGGAFRVPLTNAQVVVKSVLPGDTSLHVPKPARDLFAREVPWWEQWWPALLVLLGLGLLWWLWRKRRRAPKRVAPVVPLDAYQRAQHEFDRLERLALVEVGESGRYVALGVDVVRYYLADRIPDAVLALTSAELLIVAADDPRVPLDQLASLFADADAVKFAAHTITPTRARALVGDARAVVDTFEANDRARRDALDAARRAEREAERAARAAHEEAARKQSRRPTAGAGQ